MAVTTASLKVSCGVDDPVGCCRETGEHRNEEVQDWLARVFPFSSQLLPAPSGCVSIPAATALDMGSAEITVASLAGSAFYEGVALIEARVTFWHPSQR